MKRFVYVYQILHKVMDTLQEMLLRAERKVEGLVRVMITRELKDTQLIIQ